jgi:hypothetical protein
MTWKIHHYEPETRWCSSCKNTKIAKGGEFITYNKGLNRKWVCYDCQISREIENADRQVGK